MLVEIKRDKFIEWLKAKNLLEKSINGYMFYFDKFDFTRLNQEVIVSFINKYNNPVARAFLSNMIYFIRTGDFPHEIRGLAYNVEIPKITGRKKPKIPDVLSRDQVHEVAKVMKDKRNKFMILLSFYGGLRLSELINIGPYNFNWGSWLKSPTESGRLKVLGKGEKERIVPIIPELMREIYEWIRKDISNKQNSEDSLFKIGGRRWQVILKAASKKAINKEVNPHLLRHSCASYLRDQGLDLKEIADFLGHDSILTTQIYTQINKEKLSKRIQSAFKFD